MCTEQTKTNSVWPEPARELYRPIDRHYSVQLLPTRADRGVSRSQRGGFDSRRYQIFWEVVGLERGPLSLDSTTEEPLGRNGSGFSLENRYCGCGDMLRLSRDTLYPQKLAVTSPTSGGRSVGIVRSLTPATEFRFQFKLGTEVSTAKSPVSDPLSQSFRNYRLQACTWAAPFPWLHCTTWPFTLLSLM
jgi:hypothetical protein